MEDDYSNSGDSNTIVDTAKAERSVWLMKCPPVVSKTWQSAASAADSPNVAKVIVSLDPLHPEDPSSLQFTMEMAGSEVTQASKSYSLNMSKDFVPMCVFSETNQALPRRSPVAACIAGRRLAGRRLSFAGFYLHLQFGEQYCYLIMSNTSIPSNRKDIAWNYATLPDPKNPNIVCCSFCGKKTNGGIYRHKLHLVGGNRNVKACPKCPEHVKEEIKEFMQKKVNLKNQIEDIPDFDDIVDLEEDEDEDGLQTKAKGKRPISGSHIPPTVQGKKCKQTGPINLYFTKDVDEIVKQSRLKNKGLFDENKKKLRDMAVEKFAAWMYDAGIAFNAVKYESFKDCINAIGSYGFGMKPPSYHEVRVKYLKRELANTNLLLKSHEEDHAKYGCTIMADGWTDKKSRTLINFLVNGPKGSVFIESVDASGYSHTGDKMFELLSNFVLRIGEKNVIQVVTDNASCNVNAGRLLENRFPHLYWTPCAAHCLDLLLEDIFKKIPQLKKLHERALMVNGYIYNRPRVLSMMREFTGQRDMVRTAKTRFATAFLTLKRFQVQQANLRKMFTSEKWTNSRFSKEAAGKRAAEVILMPSFWKTVVYALKVGGPLVKVLRLVDGERKSPMGYIYEAMDRAKETIAASFNNNEEKYRRVFEFIDDRWTIQLHRPLHAAGYFLNPEFFYGNPDIENDAEVMEGLYKCISRLVIGDDLQDKITTQLEKYKKAEGLFGLPMAVRQRSSKSPADWWSSYGASTPELKIFAMKILNLTCSASGCERNWSVFEHDGRRPLLQLLHPNSTQYFSPDDLTSLGLSIPSLSNKGELHGSEAVVDDGNNEDANVPLNEGGKKDSFKRRQELLVDSGLAEKLIDACHEMAGELLRSKSGKDVIYEVSTGAADGILHPNLNEKLGSLHESIASVAAQPKQDEPEEEHLLENFHSSRTIRKLILHCREFATVLWEKALKGKCGIWVEGHSSKVIKAYLETSDSMVKEMAKEELQPFVENGVLSSVPSTE